MPKKNSPGCKCCCSCSAKDVCILLDTTGSMQGVLENFKIIIEELQPLFENESCQWSLVEYKDQFDYGFEDGWNVLQTFTSEFQLIIDASKLLNSSGGGDGPEQQYTSIKLISEKWESLDGLEGRSHVDFDRVLIWIGEAPGHNGELYSGGRVYPTRAEVISALDVAEVKVFALNVRSEFAGIDGQSGIDDLKQQGTVIAETSGGQIFHNVTQLQQIKDALCKALSS